MSSYYTDSALASYLAQTGGRVGGSSTNVHIHVHNQPESYSPHNLGVAYVPMQQTYHTPPPQTTIYYSNSPMHPHIVMQQPRSYNNVAWW